MTNAERTKRLRKMIATGVPLSRRVTDVQLSFVRKVAKVLFYLGGHVVPFPQVRPENWLNEYGKYVRWVHRKGDDENLTERGLDIYECEIRYRRAARNISRWEKTGTWIGFGRTIYANLKISEEEVQLIGDPKAEFDQVTSTSNGLPTDITHEILRTVTTKEEHKSTKEDGFTQRILASIEGGWAADQGWNFNAKAEAEVGFSQTRGNEDGRAKEEEVSNKFSVVVPAGGEVSVSAEVMKQDIRRKTNVECNVDFERVVVYVKHNTSMASSGWKWKGREGTGLMAFHNVGECSHRNTENNRVNAKDLGLKLEGSSMADIVDELCGGGRHTWRKPPIPFISPHCMVDLENIYYGNIGEVKGERVTDSKIARRVRFRAKLEAK